MVNEIRYTSIKRVLDNLIGDSPLMKHLSLEQVIRWTIRFIGLHGYPVLYKDTIVDVDIHEFRGVLPCDVIRILQVKDSATGVCLRGMTDTFTPGKEFGRDPGPKPPSKDQLNNVHPPKPWYIPPTRKYLDEPAFKTEGRIIYTSFPEGKVTVAYQAIPVDENNFPLLIDNETYLGALEAFIKLRVFTNKYEIGELSGDILRNAKQDYAMLSAELSSEMHTPSVSEMEAISRSMTALIPRMREFDNGFRDLGNREYLRRH